MQKELQQALANVLNKTVQGAEFLGQKAAEGTANAVEFLKAELPDVIKQLLMWEFCYYFVLFIGGVLLTALIIWGAFKALNLVKTYGLVYKGDWPVVLVPLFYPIIFGIIWYHWVWYNLLNLVWLKIWLAPKLYLIQYAANLVK